MKKAISILLCLMLVLSMAAPVFAAGETYTLTINNATEGHLYGAYQIFSGDLVPSSNDPTKLVLTNIVWGASVSDGAALLNAIKNLATASDPTSPLYNLAGATDAASLAELIADNITSDSESLDKLAEVFGKYLGSAVSTSTYAAGKYTIANLPAGYYLVKDDAAVTGHDSYTKFILRVLKDETVTPKSSVPSVDKTINDTVDGTFTEIEDFDIGDLAYYKWEGTLPSNLKDYSVYTYIFKDTLPTGLRFNRFEQVYLEGHDGDRIVTWLDLHDAETSNDTLPTGITVSGSADSQNVELAIADLLTLFPDVLNTHKIIVKYSATVTRDALIANPMTNKVYVEFSNNPNAEGTGEPHGKTPEDVAHAFTFKITVDKYDADNKDTKLAGAEFVLYYERTDGKHYAKVVTEEMVFVADAEGNLTTELKPESERMLNGYPVDGDDVGVVYGWTMNESEASVLDTDAAGALNVKGLDSGIYYLKETKAPAGYNLMETPVMIEITPTYTENGKEASVTVAYAVDSINQGSSDVVGVRNSSGSTLPATGGMGTTLFYAIGSVLFVGAAVLLITKKRMAA